LKIAGIYQGTADDRNVMFHQKYLDEALGNMGTVGTWWVRAASIEEAPLVTDRINKAFANTSAEVRAESERAFVLGFVSMWANIKTLIGGISIVVVFALILVTVSTMSMAIRERFRELAILKAIGFKRRELFVLILAESFGLAMLGAIIGAGGAWVLFHNLDIQKMTNGMFLMFEVTPQMMGYAFRGGAALGVLIGRVADDQRRPHQRGAGTQNAGLIWRCRINYSLPQRARPLAFDHRHGAGHRARGVRVRAAAIARRRASRKAAATPATRATSWSCAKATAESASLISRQTFTEIRYFEEIARNEKGEPVISADVLVLVNLPRRENNGEANVLLRGVTARGMELRPQVKLAAGRWFVPGQREVVVSAKLAKRFANFDIGQSFKTGNATFTVVGWLEGGGSAFDSECWLDADECRSTFERDMYSSFLIRVPDDATGEKLIARIENDRRFKLKAEKEVEYYKKQTMTAAPIKWLGGFLAVMMSVGAVFAAMNTMYAAVGARTREIGTLRVLGFRRRAVVMALMIEGGFLAFLGGIIGCAVAFYWNGYTTATMGFETFSEIVFPVQRDAEDWSWRD
jgi:putative ABC transport system permease protein